MMPDPMDFAYSLGFLFPIDSSPMEKTIVIIDLKSFYASCECACRHLDIFSTPLVCCDPYRSESSIVMSVTPYLKEKYGVPNVCRKRDLPKIKGMIFAVPRMSYYLTISAKVISIFMKYVAEEDIHVYSVDESFLNIGPYLKMYGCTAEELVAKIQKEIYDRLGLIATAGIAPNMFLAKVALDQEGKKKPPYIAKWGIENVEKKLWKIKPLSKIWGIASRTEEHLKRIGIRDVYSLAHAKDELLKQEFGIMGLQMKDLANGIDESDMHQEYHPKETSLSIGQTLIRPYTKDEARLLILEMNDELCRRLRNSNQFAQKVSCWLSFGGDGGFGHQRKLPIATDDDQTLYEYIIDIFNEAPDVPIYAMGLTYGKLSSPEGRQLSFLIDQGKVDERKSLNRSIDLIKSMYGKNSVIRCSSLLENSTARRRNEQIGGHRL